MFVIQLSFILFINSDFEYFYQTLRSKNSEGIYVESSEQLGKNR